jgi:hypothetical protein
MALPFAETLLEKKGEFNPHLIMEHFISWMTNGKLSQAQANSLTLR